MTEVDPKYSLNKMWRIGEGRYIANKDIPLYVTGDFFRAMEAWQLTKVWGMANGNIGWANEPKSYIEVITALESEHNKVEMEEQEERSKNFKAASKETAKSRRS